jgi:GxxExxY protein
MEISTESNYEFGEITNKIIQAFYQVYNEIGYGFENAIYINALDLAFKNLNLNSEKNRELEIYFLNQKIGIYKANLIVEDKILVQVFNVENFFCNLEQKVYNELKLS